MLTPLRRIPQGPPPECGSGPERRLLVSGCQAVLEFLFHIDREGLVLSPTGLKEK